MELTVKDRNCLQRLREIIADSDLDYLVSANRDVEFTDEYLIRFVRSRAHDVQSAFERVRKLQEVRAVKNPECFIGFLPSELYKGFKTGGMNVLKHRDSEERQIIIVKANCWDINVLSGDEVFQAMMMTGWECLRTAKTQENGCIVIFDIDGFTLKHVRYFTPQFVMKWLNIIIRSSPMKLKALHFINMHHIFNISLSIIKMFAPRKTAERIHTHGKPKPGFLSEFVATEDLPEWLGGNLSDNEALDPNFMKELYGEERAEYYYQFASASRAGMKKNLQ